MRLFATVAGYPGRCLSAEQVCHLAEPRAADSLLDLRDAAAAEILIEGASPFVVGQRPHHDSAHLAVVKIIAHGLEEPAPQADALVFGRKIKLVDFAIGRKRAVAAAAIRDIAGDALTDVDDREGTTAAHRGAPPARPAAGQHLLQGHARDDALVGLLPGTVEHTGECRGVFGFGASDADEKVAHGISLLSWRSGAKVGPSADSLTCRNVSNNKGLAGLGRANAMRSTGNSRAGRVAKTT